MEMFKWRNMLLMQILTHKKNRIILEISIPVHWTPQSINKMTSVFLSNLFKWNCRRISQRFVKKNAAENKIWPESIALHYQFQFICLLPLSNEYRLNEQKKRFFQTWTKIRNEWAMKTPNVGPLAMPGMHATQNISLLN